MPTDPIAVFPVFDTAAVLFVFTNVFGFLLSAWGTLLVIWGAAKAARRTFWAEAEPWKGSQIPRLEEIRQAFGHRTLLGLEFFIAGDLVRLLAEPSIGDVARVGVIVLIRVVFGLVVTREVRLPVIDVRSAGTRRKIGIRTPVSVVAER